MSHDDFAPWRFIQFADLPRWAVACRLPLLCGAFRFRALLFGGVVRGPYGGRARSVARLSWVVAFVALSGLCLFVHECGAAPSALLCGACLALVLSVCAWVCGCVCFAAGAVLWAAPAVVVCSVVCLSVCLCVLWVRACVA